MIKVIGKRDSGKTKKMLLEASKANGIVVCGNPVAMNEKAYAYGIKGVDFWTYEHLINNNYTDKPLFVDDIELFLNVVNHRIAGFSLSED